MTRRRFHCNCWCPHDFQKLLNNLHHAYNQITNTVVSFRSLVRHSAFLLTLLQYSPPPVSSCFHSSLLLHFPHRALFIHLPLHSAFAFILHCARSFGYEGSRRSPPKWAPKSWALKICVCSCAYAILTPF